MGRRSIKRQDTCSFVGREIQRGTQALLDSLLFYCGCTFVGPLLLVLLRTWLMASVSLFHSCDHLLIGHLNDVILYSSNEIDARGLCGNASFFISAKLKIIRNNTHL